MVKNKIEIIRSKRKTLSLQIKQDGSIFVRAPYNLPDREIQRFLQEKSAWIEKTLAKVNAANEEAVCDPLSPEDIRFLAKQAKDVLPVKVKMYAGQMGVSYGRITIRNQATRWGSCSSSGNLNFNCLLMLAPEKVQDYVVVHELSHRRHMNHSSAFWDEVASVMPDYKVCVKWLKDHGATLMIRTEQGKREE